MLLWCAVRVCGEGREEAGREGCSVVPTGVPSAPRLCSVVLDAVHGCGSQPCTMRPPPHPRNTLPPPSWHGSSPTPRVRATLPAPTCWPASIATTSWRPSATSSTSATRRTSKSRCVRLASGCGLRAGGVVGSSAGHDVHAWVWGACVRRWQQALPSAVWRLTRYMWSCPSCKL